MVILGQQHWKTERLTSLYNVLLFIGLEYRKYKFKGSIVAHPGCQSIPRYTTSLEAVYVELLCVCVCVYRLSFFLMNTWH